jgi:hypothetical protein
MSYRPGGAPRPHASHRNPCTSPSLSLSRRCRPCARPWRPRLRRQASRCCLAINAHWPPSMPPNRCQPPRPTVGPATAIALTVPPARHGRQECASRSRSCTRPLPSRRTPICTASSVHSRDTHAQHAYASRVVLVTKTLRTRSETNLALATAARDQTQCLHHWTQSTTPSMEHRQPSQSCPMRTTTHRVYPDSF